MPDNAVKEVYIQRNNNTAITVAVVAVAGVALYLILKGKGTEGTVWIKGEPMTTVLAITPTTESAYWMDGTPMTTVLAITPTTGLAYNITVNVSPSGAGTVLPRSGLFPLGYYDFTAASYSGVNDFNHWEINGVNRGSVNPLHIYVNGDATIVAFFGASQYSLTTSVSPSNAGFIEQTPAGSSFPANTFVTLRAYAWDNYQFDTWIDPSEIIPSSQLMFNPIQVSMNRDIELIAHFIPVTPPPSGEPVFPAPGTPGDQQTWYWVVLTTDLGNWYSSYDYFDIQGSSLIVSVRGPFNSGATQ